MVNNKINFVNILILIFGIEKLFQHFGTALLFIIPFPGIGTPNIGLYFHIANQTMAILNLSYFFLFGVGLIAHIKKITIGTILITILAMLDIILEFVFHGLFYITISVIVSLILTITTLMYLKKNNAKVKNIC